MMRKGRRISLASEKNEIVKEKSCGALIYREENHQLSFLIIRQVQGHWCFPKGHVEGKETELETAAREIKEETGLKVKFQKGFRKTTEYSPKTGVIKEVVYFLATPVGGKEKVQKSELTDMAWVDPIGALAALTYNSDAKLLKDAYDFLQDHQEDQ